MCIGKILYDDIYMKNNLIITIGRQFGSGGREIGQRLAKLFDIAYYDKELIQEAAKESGRLGILREGRRDGSGVSAQHPHHELGNSGQLFRQRRYIEQREYFQVPVGRDYPSGRRPSERIRRTMCRLYTPRKPDVLQRIYPCSVEGQDRAYHET